MLYFKGLIYHVYLIYMSMSFMSSLINVKFLTLFSGTGMNQSFFLSPGHSSLHHRVALLPVQCNLTWVRKSVESMLGKQINLTNKCSPHPWGLKIFQHSHIIQCNKTPESEVSKTRFLKPLWWISVQWSCLFFYLPVFDSSPNVIMVTSYTKLDCFGVRKMAE